MSSSLLVWFASGCLPSTWWCKYTETGTTCKEYGNLSAYFRLASLGIAFVLDNLIFDPLLSRLLGNTKFYRMRGYFYEFVLSQEYKEIE